MAKEASDPALVLANPTTEERVRVWTQTHTMWGNALSLEQYLAREDYLMTVPLARDGGITNWILTDGSLPPNERPILSSCESIRKPAIASGGAVSAGTVVDGVAHGIASVFTDPPFRGKGYAGRMLAELGAVLRTWQAGEGQQSLFSVLYSDIGKSFYARKGWAVFPSAHFSFAPDAAAEARCQPADGELVTKLEGKNTELTALAELAAVDAKLVRQRVARAGTAAAARPHVAILPSADALHWHLLREDYMTQHIFGRTPSVRGAVVNARQPGRRLWAVWTRGYYGGLATTKGNTLHVLRVVLEDVWDEDTTPDRLTARHVDGFRALMGLAQAEAARWQCGDVQLWNPTPALQVLTERAELAHKLVERETESIASLMWYGAGATEDVEWVANEKYAWC